MKDNAKVVVPREHYFLTPDCSYGEFKDMIEKYHDRVRFDRMIITDDKVKYNSIIFVDEYRPLIEACDRVIAPSIYESLINGFEVIIYCSEKVYLKFKLSN